MISLTSETTRNISISSAGTSRSLNSLRKSTGSKKITLRNPKEYHHPSSKIREPSKHKDMNKQCTMRWLSEFPRRRTLTILFCWEIGIILKGICPFTPESSLNIAFFTHLLIIKLKLFLKIIRTMFLFKLSTAKTQKLYLPKSYQEFTKNMMGITQKNRGSKQKIVLKKWRI